MVPCGEAQQETGYHQKKHDRVTRMTTPPVLVLSMIVGKFFIDMNDVLIRGARQLMMYRASVILHCGAAKK